MFYDFMIIKGGHWTWGIRWSEKHSKFCAKFSLYK